MEDMKLKEIDINEFARDVYSYYLDAFPEEERKSLKLIQISYEKQYAKIIKILYKKEFVGFKKLNCDFLLFNVIYTPYLFSNIQNKEDIIIKEIFNIYEAIAGKQRIQNNCKVIKN